MKFLILSLVILVVTCSPIFGKSPVKKLTMTKTYFCATHEYVTKDLEDNYGESRKAWALSSTNEVIEIFVNDETGQWTILFSHTNGMTCGLVGGDKGFTFDTKNPSGNKL